MLGPREDRAVGFTLGVLDVGLRLGAVDVCPEDGVQDGFLVGRRVGRNEGNSVGSLVGKGIGAIDGLNTGCFEGRRVGTVLGFGDVNVFLPGFKGIRPGDDVGFLVKLGKVGLLASSGISVGVSVGIAVGSPVGV